MNIDEALEYAQNALERAFEDWLETEHPSGDCESVHRQWDNSYARLELVDELQPVMALTWEARRLRDEVNGLTGSLDRAETVLQNLMSYLSVNGTDEPVDADEAEKRIRDGIDMLVRPAVERAERAESQLKEAREQEPVLCHAAFSNGDGTYSYEYAKWPLRQHEKPTHPADRFFYARPVPAAVAVPELSDGNLAVPEEWRDDVFAAAEELRSTVRDLKNGFVRCGNCGEQETTSDLDCVSDIDGALELLDGLLQSAPAIDAARGTK